MPGRVKGLSRAIEGSVVFFGVGGGEESGRGSCNGIVVDHSALSGVSSGIERWQYGWRRRGP